MRWKQKARRAPVEWSRYFAWHPVTVGEETVWTEWVERKSEDWCCGGCGGTSHYYRFPNSLLDRSSLPNTEKGGK